MIDYRKYLLGKTIQVFTKNDVHTGAFEGIQELGPDRSPFVILKISEDQVIFIPEVIVERMELVGESGIPGEDGEGSRDN